MRRSMSRCAVFALPRTLVSVNWERRPGKSSRDWRRRPARVQRPQVARQAVRPAATHLPRRLEAHGTRLRGYQLRAVEHRCQRPRRSRRSCFNKELLGDGAVCSVVATDVVHCLLGCCAFLCFALKLARDGASLSFVLLFYPPVLLLLYSFLLSYLFCWWKSRTTPATE